MTKLGFFERYQASAYVPVWRELIARGSEVRDEPLRSEALSVCEEIVRLAQLNIRTLHARLLKLGYEFADPENALVDAPPNAEAAIESVERELGVLPLIARKWYSTLASVNFCQSEKQRAYWQAVRPPAGPDFFGLGSHPVLIFQSLTSCRQQLQEMAIERQEHVRQMNENVWEGPYETNKVRQFLPLGGWASNCEPKGFWLPGEAIDGVIYDDGDGDTFFVDELRLAFQWGGFPFWQWGLEKSDFYSPYEYRPNFQKLLPILKEGLVEL
jgi:hypothetical protein